MTDIAADLAFAPGAAEAGAAALAGGRADFLRRADGRPRRHAARACRRNNEVICTLSDPTRRPNRRARAGSPGRRPPSTSGANNSAAPWSPSAMRRPTLFRLLEMLDDGAAMPACIIGMPVGFVGAAESKEALIAIPGIPAYRGARTARRQRDGGGGRQCAREREGVNVAGRLYGIGLGPGDPELLTVKAVRLIGACPVVAYFAKPGGAATRARSPTAGFPTHARNCRSAIRSPRRSRSIIPITSARCRPSTRSAEKLARAAAARPRRRAARRRRPAVLWLVHAPLRAAARRIRHRDRAGRHRHGGLRGGGAARR